VKSRTVTRKQLVPHTVDGVTELVLDEYEIELPDPPRDWDSIVRTGVTTIAAALVTVSLVWTTASIGDLLSMATIPVVAYAAGVAFDLTWILCMGVEWLLRYEPDRAKPVQRAGTIALLISMAAVFVHGQLFGMWPVGAAGAAVSLLAKRSWSTAMRVHARPLDSRTAQWVVKQRAALDGKLAMIPVRRELLRGEQMVEADRIARTGGSPDPDPVRDRPAPNPVPGPDRSLTTKDAVRTVWARGIRDKDDVVREVADLIGRPVSPDSVRRYLNDLQREAS
jgi:hypothetical protein